MAKVSVIIPAHNSEKYIDKCLASLSRQTFTDFEVVIADDCSSDRTLDIAAKYNARIIRLDKHRGSGAARNSAVKDSSGAWLAFADADVVLPEKWLNNFIRDTEAKGVECAAAGYSGSVGATFMERFAFAELEYRRMNFPEFVQTFPSNNFFCSRKAFSEVSGFPENYKTASLEDMVFSYKLSRQYKVYWDKENGVLHHFRPTLKRYISQQFIFARDTVVTYFDYPRLSLIKTHQGRLLYIETFVIFLSVLAVFFNIYNLLFGLAIIFILNIKFLIFSGKKYGLSILKSFLMVLTRDFVIAAGSLAGPFKSIIR